MHTPHLLTSLTAGLLAAFVGGLAARRAGLPTIVGYLLGGMAIGPFTPGFVGNAADLSALAELGVLFLMFGVGLHFSLADLWDVRRIAIPGALVQMLLSTLAGFGLGRAWGLSTTAAVVLGVSISIASTVVLLRALEDRGLLNSDRGRVAMGWLVLEDLATVLVLVLLPTLVTAHGGASSAVSAATALLKASVFVAVMVVVGSRVLPWLLARIAAYRSHELFNVAVVTVAVGTAFAASALFGVSLALGAFLAGAIIGESSLRHQVDREILPFRETFAVLFFVSIGMLVDPRTLLSDLGPIVTLTALLMLGKATITLVLALGLGATARIAVTVAAGLGQIGEFSFVVGQTAVRLGILDSGTYGRLLAAALLSITLNPLLFALAPFVERLLSGLARSPAPEAGSDPLRGHVIVVGAGRVGRHVVSVLETLHLPFVAVERDDERAEALDRQGVRTLVGDAANSDILTHAAVPHARAIVSTIADPASNELVVASCHAVAPDVPIVARAPTLATASRLYDAGAREVVEPELEGGLEVVRRTLLTLGYPAAKVHRYVEEARRAHRKGVEPEEVEHALLARLLEAVQVDVAWRDASATGPLVGRTLGELALRSSFGVSVVALVRGKDVVVAPLATARLEAGDHLGFIGRAEDVARLDAWLGPESAT